MNLYAPTEGHRPDEAAIREELHRVLGSRAFQGSKRCQDFLYYAVNRALAGDLDSLKERTVAVEVFGRRADADLDHDSIVRVGAREVRKRLTQYYASESPESAVRIDLPTGTYHPQFQTRTPQQAMPDAAPLPLEPLPFVPVGPRSANHWRTALISLLILIAVIALAWRVWPRATTPFDAFWQGAIDANTPILIGMAHPITYHPSHRAALLDDQQNGAAAGPPVQRALHLPPEALNGADFVPAIDQYVGFGDAVAALSLKGLFDQHERTVRLRLSSKLDFDDLRSSPSVLIGAYTNRWTMEMMKGLRYQLLLNGGIPSIRDTGGTSEWKLSGKADNGTSKEDYLFICRLPHSRTGGFVVMGAGLTQYGTEESGRILASATALEPVLTKLPANWKTQNLQLVLHSEIFGDSPAPPELVAWHVW